MILHRMRGRGSLEDKDLILSRMRKSSSTEKGGDLLENKEDIF